MSDGKVRFGVLEKIRGRYQERKRCRSQVRVTDADQMNHLIPKWRRFDAGVTGREM